MGKAVGELRCAMERVIVMANVFEVAKFVLDNRDRTTAWQLQKLCYYSKAWGLAIGGNPIFDEQFEAWANGPVCRRLYFRHQGKKYIPQNLFSEYSSERISEYGKAIILAVLRKYGSMSGDELSELSHSELPWQNARKGVSDGQSCEEVIADEQMKAYYSSKSADSEEIENSMLYYMAESRISSNHNTVSFEEMMARFGISADDLGDDDVEFEIEPLVLG